MLFLCFYLVLYMCICVNGTIERALVSRGPLALQSGWILCPLGIELLSVFNIYHKFAVRLCTKRLLFLYKRGMDFSPKQCDDIEGL